MSENLGVAELIVRANVQEARAELEGLQQFIQNLAGQQRQLAQQSGGRRARNTEATDTLTVQQRSLNRITTLTNQINALEARGADVANQRLRLAEALDLVNQGQFRSARQVTEEIKTQLAVERQLNQERRSSATRGARLGGAREATNTSERFTQRTFNLGLQLKELENLGVNTSSFRTGQGGLGTLTQAIADRQFGTADQIANELSRRLRLAIKDARIDKVTDSELLRIGRENAVPISGRTSSGFIFPGSPADAERVRLREIRTAQFNANRNVGASPISGLLPDGSTIFGSPADKARFASILNPSGPPGSGSRPKTPNIQEKTRSRISGAVGDALIGGAFPLLFGQGIGASIGGGFGGAVGGAIGGPFGFGLSLVGTAIGSAVDDAKQTFNDLSVALQDPINNFETLRQKSIFASKAQEDYIKALIDSGQTALATAEIIIRSSQTGDRLLSLSSSLATDRNTRLGAQTKNNFGLLFNDAGGGFTRFIRDLSNLFIGGPTQGMMTDPRLTSPGRQQALNDARGPGGFFRGLLTSFIPLYSLGANARVDNYRRQRQISFSPEVDTADKTYLTQLGVQLRTQDAINKARLKGNEPLAKSLEVVNKLNDAQLASKQREIEIAASLATGDINQQEAKKQREDNTNTLKIRQAELIGQAKNQERISAEQLVNDRRRYDLQSKITDLIGGQSYEAKAQLITANAQAKQLDLRIQQEQAGRNVSNARQALVEANKNPTNTAAISAAASALNAAINEYNSTRLKTDQESARNRKETEIQLRDLQRQRFAEELTQANLIAAIRLQQRAESIRPRLSPLGNQAIGTAQQLIQAQNDLRDARANLSQAPNDPTRINAVATAAERLKLAGITFRNNLVEAFDNAQKQVRELQRGLGQAFVSLAEQQGGSGGINGFLNQAYGANASLPRQMDSFKTLLPIFQARRAQLADEERKAGRFNTADQIQNINFRGSYEGVNKAMIDFIRAVDSEAVAREQIIQTQKDLTKALAGSDVTAKLLNTNLSNLSTVVQKLTEKDWNVYVNSPKSNPEPSPTPSPPTTRTPKLNPIGVF